MRERRPKKIYKWIRGTASVWDVAEAELTAWSKPWQPGEMLFEHRSTSQSSGDSGDLVNIISHCPLGKARGVDGWSISELRLLPQVAIDDLASMLKVVEVTGTWPQEIREVLYLQLPKEGAKEAGERRPIALLAQVYGEPFTGFGVRPAGTMLQLGGQGVPARAEVPVGRVAFAEIALHKLEEFALESAVSTPVTAIHGMPLGCGHASAGRQVTDRKYVADMVLVAPNMQVNLKKTVVICTGAKAKRLLMKVWRAGTLPPPRITTRDLGVDSQWAAWRFLSVDDESALAREVRIAKSLYSVGLKRAEVGGMSASHMKDVRISVLTLGRPGMDHRLGTWPYDICDCKPIDWDGLLARADGSVRINTSLAEVAVNRPDFAGLETSLSTQTYGHLKKSSARVDDRSRRSAVNAALGGVWHEERTNHAISVGDLCVRCREEVEDLSHILLFGCLYWYKERRQRPGPGGQVELPVDNAGTVWTAGSGRFSSDPHHRRCG
eukprot:2717150-Amphidinium_carterae.2